MGPPANNGKDALNTPGTLLGVTHHPNGRWEARIGMPGERHDPHPDDTQTHTIMPSISRHAGHGMRVGRSRTLLPSLKGLDTDTVESAIKTVLSSHLSAIKTALSSQLSAITGQFNSCTDSLRTPYMIVRVEPYSQSSR
eukprot:5269076-Pyramimonas_sp.AAC.1